MNVESCRDDTNHCKDFLCPTETRIREWFPTSWQGQIRAKALDPYGLMRLDHKGSYGNGEKWQRIYYRCKDETCHAKLTLRKVQPDSEGNSYGLFGCFLHQHPLPRDRKSEIVFENKTKALEFFEKNLKKMYRRNMIKPKLDYITYGCRRKNLQKDNGHYPCNSTFSIGKTFSSCKGDVTKKELESLPVDEIPYSVNGVFYHAHENEERYHYDEQGLWKKVTDKPRTKPYKPEKPRFKNGKVWPLSARLAGITKEDIMAAKVKNSPGFGKTPETRKKKANRRYESKKSVHPLAPKAANK